VTDNIYLWKIKLPLKIKVFKWLLYRVAILTRDNLVKRNCYENEKCCFCNEGPDKTTRWGFEWDPIKILYENLAYAPKSTLTCLSSNSDKIT
jgi:hypothetical protein